ncbi:Ankyrin repeat, bromo and BTB domain-containing protein [Tolypocladium capitatum]|uniref:Ankyrin repeat, bromo and BTB domain-containing protein n=1 Tax=Tolypocladium capitatum TaxID=45235 RepID=A0A2K3QHL0_9HYPO|nr:Ankyrin repeat, bromo and BTB domain-containing protein [Tolypocladium capitatum]
MVRKSRSMSAEATANGVTVAPTAATVTTTPTAEKPKFSWLKPHPIFVIILVGPEEQPFGIQMDFLCDRSDFYQKFFADRGVDESVEHVVKLPEVSEEVFGLAQNFIYTGVLIADEANLPSYESLVGLWNLGHKLGVHGLCDKTLEAMMECRRLTERIPATPLLIRVWRDTPEGSSIRLLLLSWAAEYMRSSDARAEFAKSLPQEVLSELVVAMSSFDIPPIVQAPVDSPSIPAAGPLPRKNVHYLDDISDEEILNNIKKNRRSSGVPNVPATSQDQAAGRKPGRTPLPKPQKRRSSAVYLEGRTFSTSQKLDFCADLLTRMLSGPGFWTRLVGPFKDPVEPVEDGVPDYFDKVKRPMDLGTVKSKMDRREYANEEDFLADVRQIFENCFTYWKKGDPMWVAGEKLQRTFEEKYSNMNKWIAKMGGEEGE